MKVYVVSPSTKNCCFLPKCFNTNCALFEDVLLNRFRLKSTKRRSGFAFHPRIGMSSIQVMYFLIRAWTLNWFVFLSELFRLRDRMVQGILLPLPNACIAAIVLQSICAFANKSVTSLFSIAGWAVEIQWNDSINYIHFSASPKDGFLLKKLVSFWRFLYNIC